MLLCSGFEHVRGHRVIIHRMSSSYVVIIIIVSVVIGRESCVYSVTRRRRASLLPAGMPAWRAWLQRGSSSPSWILFHRPWFSFTLVISCARSVKAKRSRSTISRRRGAGWASLETRAPRPARPSRLPRPTLPATDDDPKWREA